MCTLQGDFITNSSTGKRTRVPRLVRIHSDELEDIPSAVGAGLGVLTHAALRLRLL
jgi:hypothetical protein